MIEAGLIKKSISDFLSPKLLSYSILPFLISFAIFLYLYLGIGGEWIDSFKQSIESGRVPFIDANEHPILTYILTFALFKWLFAIFFYLVGAIAVVLLTVFVATAIVGFFTPAIVKVVRDKHYPEFVIKNDDFTIGVTIWHFVKIFSVFAILFLISLPFLFIPGINFFAINIPFYYLFHNTLILDVGSSINSKEEFKAIIKKHKLLFRTTTLSEYGISLIPLMGMIFQVLFVIVLAHQFFTKSMELRR